MSKTNERFIYKQECCPVHTAKSHCLGINASWELRLHPETVSFSFTSPALLQVLPGLTTRGHTCSMAVLGPMWAEALASPGSKKTS